MIHIIHKDAVLDMDKEGDITDDIMSARYRDHYKLRFRLHHCPLFMKNGHLYYATIYGNILYIGEIVHSYAHRLCVDCDDTRWHSNIRLPRLDSMLFDVRKLEWFIL